jgi:hypothetical protein
LLFILESGTRVLKVELRDNGEWVSSEFLKHSRRNLHEIRDWHLPEETEENH